MADSTYGEFHADMTDSGKISSSFIPKCFLYS